MRKGGNKTPPPDWTSSTAFELAEENRIRSEVEKRSRKIDELIMEKTKLLIELEEEARLRDLLYEKGKPLEEAIIHALTILDYKAEGYNDGNLELDQVILSPEGERFIGEAEGKDNSAVNIDKFRQLATNIQEDLARDEIDSPAIGILFGNGYRLTNPPDRAEQFTEKCVNTAKSSNCILIRTSDLFPVARYVQESKDSAFAHKCREAIKDGIRKIVSFPEIPSQ